MSETVSDAETAARADPALEGGRRALILAPIDFATRRDEGPRRPPPRHTLSLRAIAKAHHLPKARGRDARATMPECLTPDRMRLRKAHSQNAAGTIDIIFDLSSRWKTPQKWMVSKLLPGS